jgi:fatty acid/phospholipid biosynthesis enzyme
MLDTRPICSTQPRFESEPLELVRAPVQAVKVDAKAAKALREATGAGMMDAKKALADKKSGRLASEGAVGAYIHAGSRSARLVLFGPVPQDEGGRVPRCQVVMPIAP